MNSTSFDGNLLPIFINLLFLYNEILLGKIDDFQRKAKINFKIMLRKQLANTTQLSYWVLTREKNPSEYPFSFVVFVSCDVWQSLTSHNQFL